MTISVLVGFATRYGTTQEVAEVISDSLLARGLDVDVQPAKEVHSITNYDVIVLGAPLQMFPWHKDVLRFLVQHRKALTAMPYAIFAIGPVHVPHDDKEWEDSRNQLDKELANFPWLKPMALEIFGGKYDPSRLRFPLKIFAGEKPASDALDKKAVIEWAASLAAKFESALK